MQTTLFEIVQEAVVYKSISEIVSSQAMKWCITWHYSWKKKKMCVVVANNSIESSFEYDIP